MNYEPIVGLEIHVQVKTKTKMFSRERSNYFDNPPNTLIDPVSFGLPGALPIPNKAAFKKAIKLAIALNCDISQETHFDRKNYFYPDLPKGYQISQLDQPIGENGFVEIEVGDDIRRIRVARLHLEEDTAKSIHSIEGTTLVDFNKSGIPLIEIVTEPEFGSIEEVLAFAKRLRQITRYTNTSDAEMQKGQMRFELNISLRKKGVKSLPNYKVEVKNIGSISVLEKVMNFEVKRQSELLEKSKLIKNQTRGLKDMSGETVFQRAKESSEDYRYFPEPDIPPIKIPKKMIQDIKDNMPELPSERRQRYLKLGLSNEQTEIFIEDIERGGYFDKVISYLSSYELVIEVAKWINTEIVGILLKKGLKFNNIKLDPKDLIYLIEVLKQRKITASTVKAVIEEILTSYKKQEMGIARSIIEKRGLEQIQDDEAIDNFIKIVIKENQKVIKDIDKNPNGIKFLVGQVMKLAKGRVDPAVAEKKIKDILKK